MTAGELYGGNDQGFQNVQLYSSAGSEFKNLENSVG